MKINKTYMLSKKLYLLHAIFVFVLAIVCLYPIRKLDFPVVLNDEFGYWANAISFKGNNWNELIAETPYYSWGYSIWLIPLVLISEDYHITYKLAILLNVFFLIVSYFCCFHLAKKIFRQNKGYELAFISFLVIIYPSNIAYAQVTWSESLLYMLMWIITFLIFSLEENYKFYKVLLCMILLGYMYTVHQRTIGIIFIAAISVFYMILKKKKAIIHFVIAIMIFLGIYGINSIVKKYQLDFLWANSEVSTINNVSLNGNIIVSYINRVLSGFWQLLISAYGKFFYLLIATMMTILVGIWWCIKNIINKKNCFKIFSFFVLFSLVSMVAVCSLQTIGFTERKDIIVYSRYMENALGPILMIAFISVFNRVRKFQSFLVLGMGLVTISIYQIYCIVKEGKGIFNTICSPVIGAIFEQSNKNVNSMFVKIYIISMLFTVIIIFISFINRKICRLFCFVIIFTGLYLGVGYYAESYVLNWRNTLEYNIVSVKDYITNQCDTAEIYYIKDKEVDEYSMNPKYLQFMIPEKNIHVIEDEDIDKLKISNNVIFLVNPSSKFDLNNFSLAYETQMIKIFRTN